VRYRRRPDDNGTCSRRNNVTLAADRPYTSYVFRRRSQVKTWPTDLPYTASRTTVSTPLPPWSSRVRLLRVFSLAVVFTAFPATCLRRPRSHPGRQQQPPPPLSLAAARSSWKRLSRPIIACAVHKTRRYYRDRKSRVRRTGALSKKKKNRRRNFERRIRSSRYWNEMYEIVGTNSRIIISLRGRVNKTIPFPNEKKTNLRRVELRRISRT